MAAASTAIPLTPVASTTQPMIPESPINSVSPLSSDSVTISIDLGIKASFAAIQQLFNHLHAHPKNASKLNSIYPHQGIMKTAAVSNGSSNQKFTIDLSSKWSSLIPVREHVRLSQSKGVLDRRRNRWEEKKEGNNKHDRTGFIWLTKMSPSPCILVSLDSLGLVRCCAGCQPNSIP